MDMSKTHHRVAQSTIYLMKCGLTHKHRLKDCSYLSYICFPLRKSAFQKRFKLCGTPCYSVVKYTQNRTVTKIMILSFRWRKYPQMALLPLSGVVLCLSQKGTFFSPVHSLVLHVHVKLHEMCMSYCPTCTCRTALHVHLKQCYTPRLPTLLYEIGLYRYRRKRQIEMPDNIQRKTIWI